MDFGDLKTKTDYFLRSAANFFQEKKCPYCGVKESMVIDRKYVVTKLLKCKNCQLNFRFPKDTSRFLEKFYQSDYSVDTHIITKMPSDSELMKQMDENFETNVRNVVKYIRAINNKNNLKVLDYGCSWGYTLFQLKKEGYDVQGYEISKPRASFGKKLNVEIVTSTDEIRNDNDIIICSHVIEHLSDIKSFFQIVASKLKKDGILIVWCPNGSDEYRKREPEIFHVNWGFLHPNYIDIQFVTFALKQHPFLILTGDWYYDETVIQNWNKYTQQVPGSKDGKELLFITLPNINI